MRCNKQRTVGPRRERLPVYMNIRSSDIDLLSVIAQVDVVYITRGVKECFTDAGVTAITIFADRSN